MDSRIVRISLFTGVALVGTTIIPAITEKATKKSAKTKIVKTTANIDFDNMGPEIVRKDKKDQK